MLPVGQILKLGDYRLRGVAVLAAGDPEPDPWAVFDAKARRAPAAAADAAPTRTGRRRRGRPIRRLGLREHLRPGRAGRRPARPMRWAGGDLPPFFLGLGLDRARGPLTQGELEAIGPADAPRPAGRAAAAAQRGRRVEQELRAEDRTVVGAAGQQSAAGTDWPRRPSCATCSADGPRASASCRRSGPWRELAGRTGGAPRRPCAAAARAAPSEPPCRSSSPRRSRSGCWAAAPSCSNGPGLGRLLARLRRAAPGHGRVGAATA